MARQPGISSPAPWAALDQGEATVVDVRTPAASPSPSAMAGGFRTRTSFLPGCSLCRVSLGSPRVRGELVPKTEVAGPEPFFDGDLRDCGDRAQARDHYLQARADPPRRQMYPGRYWRALVPGMRRAGRSCVDSGNELAAKVGQCLPSQFESSEWRSPGESRGLRAAFPRVNGPDARRSQLGRLCWPGCCGPRDELTGQGFAA